MTCDQIDRTEVMEQYVLGQLQGSARDEFDQHLFECERCFDRLQTLRALRSELAATASARRAAPIETGRGWMWKWALAPAFAAVVLAVVSVSLWTRAFPPLAREAGPPAREPATTESAPPQTMPALPSLAELGRIQPPRFTLPSLRGADDATTRFREGMKHYAGGDYRAAIPGLRAATQLDPEAAHASFFLGVSYVLAGQLEEGIRALRQTITIGDSPYLEEAHFYLAKALLQNNDAAAARVELERTIELNGALAREARQVRAQLDRVIRFQP